jgi:hypothetical protein
MLFINLIYYFGGSFNALKELFLKGLFCRIIDTVPTHDGRKFAMLNAEWADRIFSRGIKDDCFIQ